jgi:hypothetical protein
VWSGGFAASVFSAGFDHGCAMELAALEEGYRAGRPWEALDGFRSMATWSGPSPCRTAVAVEGRIWYLAGCGITAESVPEEELAESDVKAAAFSKP